MDETFLLTNIAPQVGVGFNRHCAHYSVFMRIESSLKFKCYRLGIRRGLV